MLSLRLFDLRNTAERVLGLETATNIPTQNTGTSTTKISTQNELLQSSIMKHQAAWSRAKVVLRCLSYVMAIVAIGQSIVMFSMPTPLTSPLLTLVLTTGCIVWNTSIVVQMWRQGSWTDEVSLVIHIGIETGLWVVGVVSTVLQVASVTAFALTANLLNSTAHGLGLPAALCGILAFLSIIHFILFVRACVEMSRRRKDRQVRILIQALYQEAQQNVSSSCSSRQDVAFFGSTNGNYPESFPSSSLAELQSSAIVAELTAVLELVELPADEICPTKTV